VNLNLGLCHVAFGEGRIQGGVHFVELPSRIPTSFVERGGGDGTRAGA
jgi:hypothetical protein